VTNETACNITYLCDEQFISVRKQGIMQRHSWPCKQTSRVPIRFLHDHPLNNFDRLFTWCVRITEATRNWCCSNAHYVIRSPRWRWSRALTVALAARRLCRAGIRGAAKILKQRSSLNLIDIVVAARARTSRRCKWRMQPLEWSIKSLDD
jgi:hypothetical protein